MAKQPRNPRPIRPLVKHALAYYRSLLAGILRPMAVEVRTGLAKAYAAAALLADLDANRWEAPDIGNIARREAEIAMNRLRGYHTDQLIKTFRAALGVDIRRIISEPPIEQFMQQKIAENVDLIVTIPPRYHAGLKDRLEKALRTRPFDRQLLNEMFRDQYRASGYQLRRLTRDQTSKTIGGLTQARDEQMGITHYIWRTSLDGRVRESHAANEGRRFAWASPPADTGHPSSDVNCRCVAEPIIPRLDRR